MGYDMRWVKRDDSEIAEVEALRALFTAKCKVRNALPDGEKGTLNFERVKREGLDFESDEAWDGRTPAYRAAQAEVHAAYEAMGDAEKSYFRLNIFGMGRYRDLMERLGMAFEDDPHPPFPEAEDYGVTWDDVSAAEYPEDYPDHEWTDGALVAALKVKEASDAVLRFHGRTDTPGIPLHKFGSNDGWHVLPAECEAAVRIWRKFVADEGEEAALNLVTNSVNGASYWLKWIEYLAGAARHGGFEVR